MLKALSSAALVALIASEATSYYVAHTPNNKTCMVTENRPDGKTMV